MAEVKKLWLVGLGTIARTHLEALRSRDDVEIACGVDPATAYAVEADLPVHRSLDEAFAAQAHPDIVVVATPTQTHVELVDLLLRRTEALVLSEKPLAHDRAGLQVLADGHDARVLAERLRVAHHFAVSPEVEWAADVVAAHPEWGPPAEILSSFNDAYAALDSTDSYLTSWIDSGPNQLSMLARFVGGWQLLSHDEDERGYRSAARLAHEGGHTTLVSNWWAADTSKQTSLRFADHDVEVRMDHTSMTGLVLAGGEVVEHRTYQGAAGRKLAHYLGVYAALLSPEPSPVLGFDLAAEIAELLEEGQSSTTTSTSNPSEFSR